MGHTYQKVYISYTEYKIRQIRNDDKIRFVDEDHYGYQKWLAAGNDPPVIPFIPQDDPSADDIRKDMLANIEHDFRVFMYPVRLTDVLLREHDNAEINEIRENYYMWFQRWAEYKVKKAKEIQLSDSPSDVVWSFDDYNDRHLFDYENLLAHIRS